MEAYSDSTVVHPTGADRSVPQHLSGPNHPHFQHLSSSREHKNGIKTDFHLAGTKAGDGGEDTSDDFSDLQQAGTKAGDHKTETIDASDFETNTNGAGDFNQDVYRTSWTQAGDGSKGIWDDSPDLWQSQHQSNDQTKDAKNKARLRGLNVRTWLANFVNNLPRTLKFYQDGIVTNFHQAEDGCASQEIFQSHMGNGDVLQTKTRGIGDNTGR